MAYRSSSGPSNEVLRLQDEITHEVNTDAQHLADSVFGKRGNMPDIARVPNEVIDNRFRNAYLNNDRQWLLQEAQRDPDQFITVARRIGVLKPDEFGQQQLPFSGPPPALPQVAAPAPPVSPPGGAVPAPTPIPAPPLPMPQAPVMPAQPAALPAPPMGPVM